ncbi:MAG: thioredoxin [Spirochaetales bacterium]|nr:thioredoxin [Spirochaetales bacterium]
MSEVILSSSNFEKEVLESDIPVLVDFWATWCGPCKMIAPIISQLAIKYEGKVKVGKVDVDENPEIAESFNISSIPTLIMFKGGEVAGQRVGGANMAILDAFINENL